MKGRKHRETGGVNEAAEDAKTKNQRYTYESKVNDEAEERKSGGRAKRARGGKMVPMIGMKSHRMDRKPRKQGGGTHSDSNPYTSARHATAASAHKTESEFE